MKSTIVLAVRDGDEALLVERLSAHNASPALYRVGGRMPLVGTGVGLVLLAHAPADVQERLLAAFDPGQSVDQVRTAGELRRVLAEVRRVVTPWEARPSRRTPRPPPRSPTRRAL
jgi:DNA-binding IclR family transcriptional regulator